MANRHWPYCTRRISLLLVCALVTGSCSSTNSGLITSLEDLTSASERQGISESNQNRIISVNGLLPQLAAGSVYRYKQTRSPSTAIGITNTPSFLVESEVKNTATADQLQEIRKKISVARGAAAKAIEARLEVVAVRERLAAAEKQGANVTQLNAELSTAEGKYQGLRDGFDSALQEAIDSVKYSGVLVIRWQTNDKGSTSTGLGDLLGLAAEHDITTSGFAILSGLRLTTLFIGPDIEKYDPHLEKSVDWGWYPLWDVLPWFWSITYTNVRVTTHILQANQIVYVQDADIFKKAALELKATYQELAQLGDALREIDKVEFKSIQQRMDSLSNLGIVSDVTRKVYPARQRIGDGPNAGPNPSTWLPGVAEQITGSQNNQGPFQTQAGWHTVYVVDTSLSALQNMIED